MKLNFKVLGALFGGLVLSMTAPVASAYDVVYTEGNEVLCVSENIFPPSQPNFEARIAACAGPGATELYKADVGSTSNPATTEVGPFAGSYQTTFANTAFDPEDATIAYTGPTAIQCSATEKCFLGVKDGNANPTHYIFDISDWDGTSSIVMTGFWAGSGPAGKGAISNVSIWSSGNVPEPATLALVGIALLAAGAARRRRQA